eukprot:358176-Chlamydomonas_euryale.AAC.3
MPVLCDSLRVLSSFLDSLMWQLLFFARTGEMAALCAAAAHGSGGGGSGRAAPEAPLQRSAPSNWRSKWQWEQRAAKAAWRCHLQGCKAAPARMDPARARACPGRMRARERARRVHGAACIARACALQQQPIAARSGVHG